MFHNKKRAKKISAGSMFSTKSKARGASFGFLRGKAPNTNVVQENEEPEFELINSEVPEIERKPGWKPREFEDKSTEEFQSTFTSLGNWYEIRHHASGEVYFYNEKTQQSLWGLPLRFMLSPEKSDKTFENEDGWCLFFEAGTHRKYFRSVSPPQVQESLPEEFGILAAKYPYFNNEIIDAGSPSKLMKKTFRPKDLKFPKSDDVISKVSLLHVLKNPATCAGLHRYLVATVAEENILFYGACEVFEKGEWQGQSVLGQSLKNKQSDAKKVRRVLNGKAGKSKMMEEGQQALLQQMLKTRASFRMGFERDDGSVAPFQSMKKRAEVIFDRFLKPDSELWVCVSDLIAKQIETRISEANDKTNLFGLFKEAQTEVYDNIASAMYPDFIRGVLNEKKVKDFPVDDLLKFALIDMYESLKSTKKKKRLEKVVTLTMDEI